MSKLEEGAEQDSLALSVPFWRVGLAALTSRELGELRVTLVELWSDFSSATHSGSPR